VWDEFLGNDELTHNQFNPLSLTGKGVDDSEALATVRSVGVAIFNFEGIYKVFNYMSHGFIILTRV
jgi:hypothetical protein